MLNPEKITQWLGRFEIVRLCDSSSIYNNSRQQAPVRLQVSPFPGQTLSDTEYASLGIVFEKPDGSYQHSKRTMHRKSGFSPPFAMNASTPT